MTEPKQALVFDPAGVAPEGREELSLSGYVDGIEVAAKGLDLGEQLVKSFMAEGTFGSRSIDQIWPLVPCKIPLLIQPTESLSFDQVRANLEAKASEINQTLAGGAVLKRVLPSGKVLYADIVEAHLILSASWLAERRDFDANALLELQRLPDWYEDEVEGPIHEFTGDGSFTAIVEGTLPARVSLIVTDKSGNNQGGLLWNFRGQHYSPDPTAAWAYNAEALSKLDAAEEAILSGSYGTKVIKHPSLSTSWTPVLSTNLKAGTFLTHKGVYDVWARVYTTSGEPPWLRLLYDIGDTVAPAENTQVRIPQWESYFLVNLGRINIQEIPFGTQRWQGIIQARGEVGGENISIDRLWFSNADESSGIATMNRLGPTLPRSATYLWRDDFLQSSGAVTGKSAAVGGTYAAVASSDSTDFEVNATLKKLERTAFSDTGNIGSGHVCAGRGIGTSVEATSVAFGYSFEILGGPSDVEVGQILNYVSSTNFLIIKLQPRGSGGYFVNAFDPAGKLLASASPHWFGRTNETKGALLSIVEGKLVIVYLANEGEELRRMFAFEHTFAGVKGKFFVTDEHQLSTACTRRFDDIGLWELQADAAVFANKNARLATQGMFRQSEDGLAYGHIAYPGADLPRLPVSGPDESPVEIAVKPSRGDFDTLPDSGKDAIKVQLLYRPCWSQVPSS